MHSVKISGMSCQHCSNSVKKALEEIQGISNVDVNLEKAEAYYTGDIDLQIIKDAVLAIGFEVD